MSHRVYNFGAGPAMLPLPVMERIRDEFLDYRGMGASVIEISHRSKEFQAIQDEAKALLSRAGGTFPTTTGSSSSTAGRACSSPPCR